MKLLLWLPIDDVSACDCGYATNLRHSSHSEYPRYKTDPLCALFESTGIYLYCSLSMSMAIHDNCVTSLREEINEGKSCFHMSRMEFEVTKIDLIHY